MEHELSMAKMSYQRTGIANDKVVAGQRDKRRPKIFWVFVMSNCYFGNIFIVSTSSLYHNSYHCHKSVPFTFRE